MAAGALTVVIPLRVDKLPHGLCVGQRDATARALRGSVQQLSSALPALEATKEIGARGAGEGADPERETEREHDEPRQENCYERDAQEEYLIQSSTREPVSEAFPAGPAHPPIAPEAERNPDCQRGGLGTSLKLREWQDVRTAAAGTQGVRIGVGFERVIGLGGAFGVRTSFASR